MFIPIDNFNLYNSNLKSTFFYSTSTLLSPLPFISLLTTYLYFLSIHNYTSFMIFPSPPTNTILVTYFHLVFFLNHLQRLSNVYRLIYRRWWYLHAPSLSFLLDNFPTTLLISINNFNSNFPTQMPIISIVIKITPTELR